jgi:hypothetical protein
MKTIKSSFRLWVTVLLIFAGALCLEAIWAETIDNGGHPGPHQQFDNCWADMGDCNDGCTKNGGADTCYGQCQDDFNACTSKINWNRTIGSNPGHTPPPNAVNPISSPSPTLGKHPIGPPRKLGPNLTPSPTPRKHPIKPPRKLGPSPSPTAKPILLAKPTSPTPSPSHSPKKTSNNNSTHGHH